MESVVAIEYLLYASLILSLLVPLTATVVGRTSKLVPALAWAGILAFALSSGLAFYTASKVGQLAFYNGLVIHDTMTATILMAASAAAAVAMLGAGRDPQVWESSPAYYSLLPLALFGSFYIAGATDALLVLAAWLLVSVISYVFIALPSDKASRAAAVRYILMGAVATLFLAVWVAASTVSAGEEGLASFSITVPRQAGVGGLAVAALIAAVGFKIGVVPFHWWLPSVYGRADGRVVSVVAGVLKLAFIALLARLVYLMAYDDPIVGSRLALILSILAIVTMTYGNVAGLTAGSLRTILAYSSIAHVGYILVGAAALAYYAPLDPVISGIAMTGIAIQALAYGMAKSALFNLTVAADELGEARGMLGSDKAAGSMAAVLFLSLLGLPPLLGFWGKLYLFLAAASYSVILVAIALVNSAISAGYYVRAIRELVSEGEAPKPGAGIVAALILAGLATIILGVAAPILAGLITPPLFP